MERDESPLESAHREFFEETEYRIKILLPFTYDENFFVEDEPNGEYNDEMLEKFLNTTEIVTYIAVIDESQEPILDPNGHIDRLLCYSQIAYEKILWAIGKKSLRLILEYLRMNKI